MLDPQQALTKAHTFQQANRHQEAVLLLRAAIAVAPQAILHYNLGVSLQQIGLFSEAIASYRNAIQLQPIFPEALNNLGACLQMSGQHSEAQMIYRDSANNNPTLHQAQSNYGAFLLGQGRSLEALPYLERAHAIAPSDIDTWTKLDAAYATNRHYQKEIETLTRLRENSSIDGRLVCPGVGLARFQTAHDESCALTYAGKALANHQLNFDQLSQLIGLLQQFDVEETQSYNLSKIYSALNQTLQRQQISPISPHLSRTHGSKIRLGYIGPDFRKHVMGRIMLPVLHAHNKADFEISIFYTARARNEDAITQEFQSTVTRFVALDGTTDEQAAKLIASYDLDVLVDLAGHTEGARPGIYAYKPARVILTHLGYHGAIGLSTVDYKVTDKHADLPGNENDLVEGLIALDGVCILPLVRQAPADNNPYTRAALKLEGKFVFAQFINILKLSPRCLSLYKQVLDGATNTVLAFSPMDKGSEWGFRNRMNDAGIGEDRYCFIPILGGEAERRSRYAICDAVLDTMPYSGGDTTLAALDMGLPVVTLEGREQRHRVTTSILKHLGVEDTITQSEGDYVALAIKLATDKTFYAKVRHLVETKLTDSSLVDIPRYTAALEVLYRKALLAKGVDVTKQTKLSATDFHIQFQQGMRSHQSGDHTTAERMYLNLLQDQPHYPQVNFMYAKCLQARGEHEAAANYFARTLITDKHHADANLSLGNILFDAGEYDESTQYYMSALVSQPDRADILNALGLAYLKTGEREAALQTFERAIISAPADPLTFYNLATAQQNLGISDQARANFRQAVTLKPDYLEAFYNYGILLRELGQNELAVKCWHRCLKIDSKFEDAYWQLRPTLLAAGQVNAWLDNMDQFEKHFPNSPRHSLYQVESLYYLGKPQEARKALDQAISAALNEKDVELALELLEELLYINLFFDISQNDQHSLYRRYDALTSAKFPRLPLPKVRDTTRRIRIGYISGDLKNHVMGYMLENILKRHDRKQFEVTAYALGLARDTFTGQIANGVEHFEFLSGLTAEAAAARIRADDIDVLIDCSTHTKGSQPAIMVMKPARVQITHIASSGSLGSSAIDFKLSDSLIDLPDSEAFMLEKLLPIDGCLFPFRHVPAAPTTLTRRAIGLPEKAFIFGAFVQILKLSPRCLSVWKKILDRNPQAMIAFSPSHIGARQGYINLCLNAGIQATRICFIDPGLTASESMARFAMVDAILDPFPYGGVNGSLEAIDAAKPIVALVGRKNQERTSYSILSHLGVTETVAHSETEYVECACRLVMDAGWLSSVSKQMAQAINASLLANMDGHVRALEASYREALKRTNH